MADAKRGEIKPVISVKITGDEKSGYAFAYSGEFADVKGNLYFTIGRARRKKIRMKFSIDAASVKGARFLARGDEAFWIVEKALAGPDGCPQGPYRGDQFRILSIGNDRRALRVLDQNDDGKVYRYALRFEINGKTIVDDPDTSNDHDPPRIEP